MLAPIVGALLIVSLAVFLNGFSKTEMAHLEHSYEEEYKVGQVLSEIGSVLAANHVKIYDLLSRINAESDQGQIYLDSKPFLFALHELEVRIAEGLTEDTLVASELVEVSAFIEKLQSYRVNATNALLMATVDDALTKRVMSEASTQFNDLNARLLKLNREIDERLDLQIAERGARLQDRIDLFSALFFGAAALMVVIGIVLTTILSKDLRVLVARLDGMLDRGVQQGETGERRFLVDKLRYAINRVGENYVSLERTQDELTRTNERLRHSFELVAEREQALARVNEELKHTVMHQEELIQAQLAAESARDAALKSAEQANSAKSDFLSNMSHELRTPLNAILGFAGMIRSATFGPIGSKYQEYARDIEKSGDHLLGLVTDILDIARIEAGEIEVSWDQVSIKDVFDSCETMTRIHAVESGIALRFDIPRGFPDLHTDAFRLRQVFLNLIENAIKYTPAGGAVRVAASTLDNGQISVVVSDTGIGIAEEDLPIIFEKFGQIRTGHMQAHSGAGIGLAIAKSLVELLDGEIRLESEVGKGTIVTVTFSKERTYMPPDCGASNY